jgi:hypothetical protein
MEEKDFINSFQKIYMDQIKEGLETRLDGMDRALALKTTEIDRRLEEHNKLREEVVTDRSQFMMNEVYRADRKTWQQWKDSVNSNITKLMTDYETKMSKTNWISLIAVVITIINLVAVLFSFFIR